MVVHTLGHSTLPLADFLAILDAYGIGTVADVRRFPASRRHPQFGREALATALADAGRRYEWLPALGGRRSAQPSSPHVAWQNVAFRAYADHLDSDEFRSGLAALLALAAERPTAVMCAEAVPWRCHRQVLSDALVARGIEVRHILGPTTAQPHRLAPFARLDGDRIVYDGHQLRLPRVP